MKKEHKEQRAPLLSFAAAAVWQVRSLVNDEVSRVWRVIMRRQEDAQEEKRLALHKKWGQMADGYAIEERFMGAPRPAPPRPGLPAHVLARAVLRCPQSSARARGAGGLWFSPRAHAHTHTHCRGQSKVLS